MVSMLASLWLWWRFCRSPTLGWAALTGLAVGLVHGCKYTALTLWPMILGISLWWMVLDRGRNWPKHLLGLATVAVITLLVLDAAYGFERFGEPLGSHPFRSSTLQALAAAAPRLRVPLPSDFLLGYDLVGLDLADKTQGYAFGQRYWGGVWWYYPAALICKVPLGMWLLAALAWWSLRRRLTPRVPTARGAGILAVVAGAGLMMAMASPMNIGIRHLLPLFPLAFILISRVWAVDWPSGHRVRRLLLAAVAGLTLEHALIAPRYLTFCNAAVGGPRVGYRWMNDSNFDWGQGLIDLRRWMQRRGVPRVQLAYFGSVDPAVYGISYTPLFWPGQEHTMEFTEPYLAVSSYYLVGLSHRLQTAKGRTDFVRLGCYRQLQRRRPIAVVGSTIFVYRRDEAGQAAGGFLAIHPELRAPRESPSPPPPSPAPDLRCRALMSRSLERLAAGAWVAPWVWQEHLARYRFAAEFVRGKLVVDCACGEGFGARMLADSGARRVDAFDASREAIARASAHRRRPGLRFCVADALSLPLADQSVDVYVSFETIEHLQQDESYLTEVVRVLASDGLFLCSTPNRAVTNPGATRHDRPWNRWHVREYARDELEQRLRGCFVQVAWHGQHPISQRTVESLSVIGRRWPAAGVWGHRLLKGIRFACAGDQAHAVAPHTSDREICEYLIASCATPRRSTAR